MAQLIDLVDRLSRIEEGVKGLYGRHDELRERLGGEHKAMSERVDNLEMWKTRTLAALAVLGSLAAPGSWVHSILDLIKI